MPMLIGERRRKDHDTMLGILTRLSQEVERFALFFEHTCRAFDSGVRGSVEFANFLLLFSRRGRIAISLREWTPPGVGVTPDLR